MSTLSILAEDRGHHCPDGICADIAATLGLAYQAVAEREREHWARAVQVELKRIRAARGKRVKMLRRQVTGS
jgi:hypothetical protein